MCACAYIVLDLGIHRIELFNKTLVNDDYFLCQKP